jgi:DNA-binding response OmpR family regulator
MLSTEWKCRKADLAIWKEEVGAMDKERVLVVDDEQLNLYIIEEFLENEDIELVLHHKPLEAWASLSAPDSNFSLVVLDRMMPDLDGMEFLRRMKREARFVDIPVIMQTAASSPDQVREGLEAGAYYYLTKPYEPEALISIVRGRHGRSPLAQPVAQPRGAPGSGAEADQQRRVSLRHTR